MVPFAAQGFLLFQGTRQQSLVHPGRRARDETTAEESGVHEGVWKPINVAVRQGGDASPTKVV